MKSGQSLMDIHPRGHLFQSGNPGHKKLQEDQVRETMTQGNHEKIDDENAYISHMLKLNLRGYICHNELDMYAQCLKKKNLIPSLEAATGAEVNLQIARVKCESEVKKYERCLTDEENQHAIVLEAMQHSRCTEPRMACVLCFEKNPNNVEVCMRPYNAALRCGLNFLWNDYWKALTGFGEADEYSSMQGNKEQRRVDMMNEFVGRQSKVASKLTGGLVEEIPVPPRQTWRS